MADEWKRAFLFRKNKLSEIFFFFQPLWLNKKTQKRRPIFLLSEEQMFFFFFFAAFEKSNTIISQSSLIWQPPHNWKVRKVISPSKLGFHTLIWVLCKYLSSARDYAAVFLSALSQLILLFLDHDTVLVLSVVLTYHTHRDVKEAFQEQRGGRHVNEAGLCVERGAERKLCVFVHVGGRDKTHTKWNWAFTHTVC